jgi:hypothetical protein
MNLSQESLTSGATQWKLQTLQMTHPGLYAKLVTHDTAPDPEPKVGKTRKETKNTPTASTLKKSVQKKPAESSSDQEEEDDGDSPFNDQCDFDDDMDVPVEILVDHVLSEDSVNINGLVKVSEGLSRPEGLLAEECDDGGNDREKIDVAVQDCDVLPRRRSSRAKKDHPRWFDKDWMSSNDICLPPSPEPKPKKRKHKRAESDRVSA